MPNPDQTLNRLNFTFVTGDDDVRGNSNVYTEVVLLQGEQVNTFSKSMNGGQGWAGGSAHDSFIDLPDIVVRDIQGIRVTFASGSCFLCTEDNWNMNSIKATYLLDDGQQDILIEQAGDPLHRFTGSAPVWSTSFNWPPK